MTVTIRDLALYRGAKEDENGGLNGSEFERVGLAILGGCVVCGATLAAYNGCPTKSGYWACLNGCVGDDGWQDVAVANADIFGVDDGPVASRKSPAEKLECLQDGPDCRGPVEWRLTPDRDDAKSFPRCEFHHQRRLDQAEKTRELLSDVPPAWFDPSYAGEQWDED